MVSPWIAGALGWAFFGPLGGLFGYAAGSLFNAAQREGAAGGGGPQAGPEAARNGFIASLMALTAAMMKADGRATKSELDVVKAFFGPLGGLFGYAAGSPASANRISSTRNRFQRRNPAASPLTRHAWAAICRRPGNCSSARATSAP